MQSQTVDFGIDLGTTNSAVACARKSKVEVIKSRFQTDTTPSAVAHTSRGQTLVGQDAWNKIDLNPALKFKRVMGTSNRVPLNDGIEMSPEELSAEVLKELKASVQQRYDLQLEHVVITVPAMFRQPQCDATHRAAELAGLQVVLLLQEPIAAATAYLNDDPDEGTYLVYDLGGGTFDVSVVRLRDQEMAVIAHGGDNYLGGSEFDAKVYEWALEQIERAWQPCPEFADGANKTKLLRCCEDARIRLSTQESTFIDLGDFDLPIAQLPIDRARLEYLIESYVARTIELTRERLDRAALAASDIRRMLLIGGPTMTPYIRRRLKDEFGFPISFDQDPMTAVACGAAVCASSILRPDRGKKMVSSGQNVASVELHYDAVSPDTRCTIAGLVRSPEGFAGEVRLARESGDWDSGWIPLRKSAFSCEVALVQNASVQFQLSIRDLSGTIWRVVPDSISIRHGIAAARPVTPYDYGVADQEGNFRVVLPKGQALPAVGTHQFEAGKTVPKGSNEELVVYFLEGTSSVARENVRVGKLLVFGTDLPRTVHEGDKIDVRVHMDESRLLKARVSIPILDVDYPVEFRSMMDTPPVDDLMISLREYSDDIHEISDVVDAEDEDAVLQARRELEYIEAEMDGLSRGQIGEADKVASLLSSAKARVRALQVKYGPQAKYEAAMEAINDAQAIVDHVEDSIDRATIEDLKNDAEKCLRLESVRGLESVKERADNIFWRHYRKTEECWVGLVQHLRDERSEASDYLQYDEYLKRAEGCLQRRDYEGVRVNGLEAMSYLPKAEAERNRFYDTIIRSN